MRKGILVYALIILIVIISVAVQSRQESVSFAAIVPRDLISNGDFQDGLKGWTLEASGIKPQYDFVQSSQETAGALALVAEQSGTTRISQQVLTDTSFVRLRFKANFLSTRGNGQIKITALDANNQALATLGWAVVGDLPPNSPTAKWHDLRVAQNYLGNWLEQDIMLNEHLIREFPQFQLSKIRGYQFDFIVTDGQHGVITDVSLVESRLSGLVAQITVPETVQVMGEDFSVSTTVTNWDSQPQTDIIMEAVEPYGWGLVVREPRQKIELLQPGESKTLTWTIAAQRSSQVNLGKPWELIFRFEGAQQLAKCLVEVQDVRPGLMYYVLTDDLEPIDGAGYQKAYGNQNAWLDPEEFTVQLVQKAEKLNRIADVFGAKWSHYIAWTAVVGAEWASGQSKTGQWPIAIEKVKQSVESQSKNGHEYAAHMHSDYDLRLPGNILRYNSDNDGFWANHRRHGWAHNLPELGDFEKVASRTGTLFDYQSRLTDLMRRSSLGQIIATRVGSFDFGDTADEEAKSMEAYRRVGMWAGSDADGNMGGVTGAAFSQSLYLTAENDINKPAVDLHKIGILQFRPNPLKYIAYDVDSAPELNQKVMEGVHAYVENGKVKPGVHAIVGFTHTMFIMGSGDWRSLEGGQFTEIENHLAHVNSVFVQPGLLRFATSSEMAKAYWDYYTPKVMAVYGPEQAAESKSFIYPIQIIGRQIPADDRHIHDVSIKYPLYLRDKAYKVEVRKNDHIIMSTYGLPTPYNDVVFSVDDMNARYTLHVYTDPVVGKFVKIIRWLRSKIKGIKN